MLGAPALASGAKLWVSPFGPLEENEQIVQRFLKNHKDCKLQIPKLKAKKSIVTVDGYIRTWPQQHGVGGSFAALIKKG